MQIRNIAIIAHVDHGKTTLTDALMRQTGMVTDEAVSMDSFALEKERGITIYAKNASLFYKDTKINIVDTPGHADFGSEVERVLRSIDSVLLLVDAQEGPMPQTKFVLKKSLELGLKPIVVINKIDKPAARPKEAHDLVLELFFDLGATDEQLNFTTVYAIGRQGIAKRKLEDESNNLDPLLDTILEQVPPAPADTAAPLRMQPFNLGYDNYVGRLAVGRVYEGVVHVGDRVTVKKPVSLQQTNAETLPSPFPTREGIEIARPGTITKLYTFEGMQRKEVEKVEAGDIVMIAGIADIDIGETICASPDAVPLPAITVDEPTISLDFLVNNSPFAGREGKFVTSRQIRERLEKELEINVGLKIDFSDVDTFKVYGRGELHIAVLLENMRREGYELQVSQPQVIIKEADGVKLEPFEEVTIDVPEEMAGVVIEKLSKRKAQMTEMRPAHGHSRLVFEMPTRGLLGYRSQFIVDTRGEGIMASRVVGFRTHVGEIEKRDTGSMISMIAGKVAGFALWNLQDRGAMYIEPNVEVYEGMVIGNTAKGMDMAVNPVKGKQLTNMRASGSDEAIQLTPPVPVTLERGLEIMHEDEYLEITPKSIRLRKQFLTENERVRAARKALIIVTALLAMISVIFGAIPVTSADCPLAIGRPYKAKESSTVYYIDNACSKRAIKNEAVYFSHFASWKDVKTVSAAALLKVPDSRLSFLPWGLNKTFQSGTVMKTIDDPRVYLLIQDTVFPISSEHVFKAMGFSLTWVEDVAPEALSRYLRGPVVTGPSNYPNGLAFKYVDGAEVYYLINHQLGPRKWRVLSGAQLRKNYRPDRVATLPNSLQFADADLTLILPLPPADSKTKELVNFRDNDANRASPVGVNLSRVRYYETSWPFIDAMKNGSPWLTQTAHGEIWDTKEPLDLDRAGWIKSLPQADSPYQYRRAATHLFVNSGRYPAGKYIVLYDGEGTLEYVNDGVKIISESRPSRDVIDVSAPNEGIVIVISATDPKKNGNYLRNIRVMMPGGICDNNPFVWQSDGSACKGKYTVLEQAADTLIFHPEFLAGLSKNRVIRFTHAANIAENETTIWGERPKLSDRIWNDEIRGWPEELYPVLAGILSADAWFSMPYRASDDYVRSFARMAKAGLTKNQTVYIEYSADGWDQGRKASQYMAAQAKREWEFVTGNAYLNGLHWYGKRSVEVCDIWKNEFGDERGRVKCVVSGLVSYQYINVEILDCTLWSAHGGRLCGNNFDVLAVAPYFGWFTGANNRSAMRSWMKEPDGGFNRFFTEVFVGGDLFRNTGENQWGITAHPSGPITDVLEQISQTKKIADKYKLDLVAYEGGQRFLALDPADADIADFFNRANRDPRMGMVYEKYLQGWKANGGHLFVHYADVQKSDRWGSYGLREYQDQPRAKAPKFDAVSKFIETTTCWWNGCERK